MFHALKDLLPGALRRGHILPQVEATRVVRAAQEMLSNVLPGERLSDARAVSFHDGILTIECLHGSVADVIQRHADDLTRELIRLIPNVRIRLSTRLVGEFRDTIGTHP